MTDSNAGDPTTEQPASPPPPPPPPPAPAAGGPSEPPSGGSKKGLLIGGGILVVVLALVAFLALGGDDDDDSTALRGELASQLSEDGQLDDEQADCVAGHIIDEIGAERFEGVDFDEDPPAELQDELLDAAFGAMAECGMDPSDFLGEGLDESDDADDSDGGDGTYGSDPELDALYDDCEAGDYQACDDLYMESPSGSEYEEFGDTCGGRNEPSGFCVDLYEGGGDAGDIDFDGDMEEMLADIYEESMGLDRERAECLAGKLSEAISSGDMSEEQAMSDVFEYLSDCDISMSEIGAN